MNISFDASQFRHLHHTIQAKVPRAITGTLNKVVVQARKDLVTAENAELGLTNKFIPNSTQYEPARTAFAEVGILNRVTFSDLLISGGERTPTNRYIAVPARNVKLKNIPKIKNTFALREDNGKFGIWKNVRDGIKFIASLHKKTQYTKQPYLKFEESINNTMRRIDFERMLSDAILKVI